MANDEIPITRMGRDQLIAELERLRRENAQLRTERDRFETVGILLSKDVVKTGMVTGVLVGDPGATPIRNDTLRVIAAQHKEIVGWRPEVGWFATAMEAKLRQNDFKGHWRHERATDMLTRAQEELNELRELADAMPAAQLRLAERPDDPGHRHAAARHILGEAADVGNIVMMVADLCARGMRL